MPDRSQVTDELELSLQLRPAQHRPEQAPPPDAVSDAMFRAYMKTPHDVGGELDIPSDVKLKQYEQWEVNTYVTCECLGWRGIWVSEERRRMQNVDVGLSVYLGLPYYARWLLATARVLVEKHHITLTELIDRMDEVRRRHAGGLTDGRMPDAQPRGAGDPEGVERNHHHLSAQGIGDPQCYAGKAGAAAFAVGDAVRVRRLPTIFYTRTQEYVRGAAGTVVRVSYESVAAEEEAWDRTDQRPEWFYIVRFRMVDLWGTYAGPEGDTLQTEIPERWLEAASEKTATTAGEE